MLVSGKCIVGNAELLADDASGPAISDAMVQRHQHHMRTIRYLHTTRWLHKALIAMSDGTFANYPGQPPKDGHIMHNCINEGTV